MKTTNHHQNHHQNPRISANHRFPSTKDGASSGRERRGGVHPAGARFLCPDDPQATVWERFIGGKKTMGKPMEIDGFIGH